MKFLKRISIFLVTVIVLGGVPLAWFGKQEIADWWMLREYTPPQEVVQLADETTMTPKARRLFYVNHPQIAQANQFNQACSQEASIIIGCYISDQGIFIYDIADQRLAGIKQVTAAHEMLHVAYERLSADEKQRIDRLTNAFFLELNNPRIKESIEKYRTRDPYIVPNELHSILATEVAVLTPELEEHYKKYFINRQAVIGFSKHYEAEFTNREQQVTNYDNQLANLKSEIEANQSKLSAQAVALNNEKQRLDNLLAQNLIAEYNSGVPGFNADIRAYNALVKQIDESINQYNTIVSKRNDIALEIHDLANSIDSRPKKF